MKYLELFKKYKVDSKDTADLVENAKSGELTLNEAEEITEGTDKHPVYFKFRVNGELEPEDLPGPNDLAFKKYLTFLVNDVLKGHEKRLKKHAEELRGNPESERLLLGWNEDGFKEYLIDQIKETSKAFLGVLSSYADDPSEKFNQMYYKLWDMDGEGNFWDNVREIENQPVKVNMDPPPVVLNTVNRRDMVTNLSESQRCPFNMDTLTKLNEDELKDLAGLCEPVADYSGRGVAEAFLEDDDEVPNIVLNESNKDD